MVGYPILTAMIVTAPALIEVLFGARWLPSVLPFQILCVASMLKLLNMYASTATQAKGMIWSEVKRQSLFTGLLVLAVAALSRFGIAGAAVGVLLATACMTPLMQTLVKNLAGLEWRDLLAPQLPAVLCSMQMAVVLAGARLALYAWFGEPHPLTVLGVSAVVGTCCYLAFVLFAPIRQLRELVEESLHDLVPGLARRMPAAVMATKKVPA
jgi:PST family polysaccharide transporter